jgi:hypothetical protein
VERTSLYRHFDAEGRLLYVGISCHVGMRTYEHRRGSHWYFDIVRIEVEHYPNRLRAERAEAIAIRDEDPLHNVWQPEVYDLKELEEWEEEWRMLTEYPVATEG